MTKEQSDALLALFMLALFGWVAVAIIRGNRGSK